MKELTQEEMEQGLADPRSEIEQLILDRDLRSLLLRAGEVHGHYCSYLSMGVKAGAYALKEMGSDSDGMEGIIAIVETNNCFTDGIQTTTACSFGNNALIYKDYGKTAVTFTRRDGKGIRISLRPDIHDLYDEMDPELSALFKKVVKERAGTEEDMKVFKERATRMSFGILDLEPERIFKIERVSVNVPDLAPIFESIQCSKCGESVMATRLVEKDGDKLCIPCAGADHLEMDGSGLRHGRTGNGK